MRTRIFSYFCVLDEADGVVTVPRAVEEPRRVVAVSRVRSEPGGLLHGLPATSFLPCPPGASQRKALARPLRLTGALAASPGLQETALACRPEGQ